jgi:nucleoside-triphosphatase THEP1
MPGESAVKLGYVSVAGRGRIDLLLADVVERLKASRLAIAGTVQTNIERDDRPKCDMDLRLLPDGPVVRISVDRGAGARGCRLDAGALEQSVSWVAQALDGAELLVVNKFGKQEAEGRGLTAVIADALERGLPVLVGVNGRNLPAFLDFAGSLATELVPDAQSVADWCLAARQVRPA